MFLKPYSINRITEHIVPSNQAAVAEWSRHRIVAGFVTSSSPVPLKTRCVGQRCTLNLSRAETSSRWCGVVVRRERCQLRCCSRHLTMVQNYSLVYADKLQTLDHLEDNIRRVIADIRPQMLEKVIENWTSRLDYIRASRGSPMPEIIFKIKAGTEHGIGERNVRWDLTPGWGGSY
ncbi:uncharacterized protein TNCV_1475021 [Trichonephila clavipes]|nr:uncharacterized protein TNCV_1475021 [Trichonephila clavipes]